MRRGLKSNVLRYIMVLNHRKSISGCNNRIWPFISIITYASVSKNTHKTSTTKRNNIGNIKNKRVAPLDIFLDLIYKHALFLIRDNWKAIPKWSVNFLADDQQMPITLLQHVENKSTNVFVDKRNAIFCPSKFICIGCLQLLSQCEIGICASINAMTVQEINRSVCLVRWQYGWNCIADVL